MALGLVQGKLVFEQNGERSVFHPGEVVEFKLAAKEDQRAGSLVVELAWRRPLEVISIGQPARPDGRAKPKRT